MRSAHKAMIPGAAGLCLREPPERVPGEVLWEGVTWGIGGFPPAWSVLGVVLLGNEKVPL